MSTNVRRGPACFYSSKRATHPPPDHQTARQIPDNTVLVFRQPITKHARFNQPIRALPPLTTTSAEVAAQQITQPSFSFFADVDQTTSFDAAAAPSRRSPDPRAVPDHPRSSFSPPTSRRPSTTTRVSGKESQETKKGAVPVRDQRAVQYEPSILLKYPFIITALHLCLSNTSISHI